MIQLLRKAGEVILRNFEEKPLEIESYYNFLFKKMSENMMGI